MRTRVRERRRRIERKNGADTLYFHGAGKQQKKSKGEQRGKELSVRDGCEIKGVNSQGWMMESREDVGGVEP